MCLVLFAFDAHPRHRLVLAANRDEYHGRPTAPLGFWAEAPQVLAGRDLLLGGTWLGVSRDGRYAAITNYRGRAAPARARSRGALAADYLLGSASAAEWAAGAHGRRRDYAGFNLLVGDGDGLWYVSSESDRPARLAPGVRGLANALLDTPWPKVERGKRVLAGVLEEEPEARDAALLAALADRTPPADDTVADPQPPGAFERALACAFIHAPERGYGTRCSTLLTVDRDGAARMVERRFDANGDPVGDTVCAIAPAPAVRRALRD